MVHVWYENIAGLVRFMVFLFFSLFFKELDIFVIGFCFFISDVFFSSKKRGKKGKIKEIKIGTHTYIIYFFNLTRKLCSQISQSMLPCRKKLWF